MPVVNLTPAELRYLAKMTAESLRVMEFMANTKKLTMPDLSIAKQLHAKFSALLPEGVPDVLAEFSARPAKRQSKRAVQKRSNGKTSQI